MAKLGNTIKRIINVNAEAFFLKVEFDDGEIIDVSLGNIFNKPKGLAAEVLVGGMFERCFLDSGAVAWPNGLELCPDAMRMWAQQKKPEKPAATRRRA